MIALDVCCNDPDNGLFAHKAERLQLGICEFEARRDPAPRFVLLDNKTKFRLAGKVWPIDRSKDWYGNWCWNRYVIWERGKTPGWWMVDFLKWLRGRELYDMDTGTSDLYRWWRLEGPNRSSADLHAMIFEACK